MPAEELRLKSVSVVPARGPALAPLDLDVAPGEHLGLVEDGDQGGSALLALAAGTLRPDIGYVLLDGVDVTARPPAARSVRLVPRGLGLFPALDVAANVAFALDARATPPIARRARLDEMLARFDLVDLRRAAVESLDPFARLRVALARAVAIEPAVLLLEAPFDGLTGATRRAARALLADLRRDLGASVLELGGEPADLLADVDRLGVLHGGRLIQIDTPDRLWSSPVDLGVAHLLGEVNVVTGRLARRLDGVVEVDTALGRLRATALDDLAEGTPVAVAIRPERIGLGGENPRLHPTWNRLDADFLERRLEGPTLRLVFAVGGERLTLRRPDRGLRDLVLAGPTTLIFPAEDARVFAARPNCEDPARG